MINKTLLIFIMLLMFIPFSYGFGNYNNTGFNNYKLYDTTSATGLGQFDGNVNELIKGAVSLPNSINIPMVADLDNDGDNEIIAQHSNIITVYEDDTLSTSTSITTPNAEMSQMVLFDIDQDGFTEIIFADEVDGFNPRTANISILGYNGTDLALEIRHEILGETTAGGQFEVAIQCGQEPGEDPRCLHVLVQSSSGSQNNRVKLQGFDESSVGSSVEIINIGGTGNQLCLPAIPSIAYDNDDFADSRNEFIFTFAHFVSGTDTLYVNYVDVTESLVVSVDDQFTYQTNFGNTFNPTDSFTSCEADNLGKYFTSPVVSELTGSEPGKETIVGLNLDDDQFKILTFTDNEGNNDFLDDHPENSKSEGTIISNPMVMQVFGNTAETEDFCVMGLNGAEGELELVCGSEDRPFGQLETMRFKHDISGLGFNISQAYRSMNIIAHAVEHDDTPIDVAIPIGPAVNTAEVLTSYGIFQLGEFSYNGSLFLKTLDLLWDSPIGDSACIQADFQRVGSDDLICLSSDALRYIDDQLTRLPPSIVLPTESDPCVDDILKVNSSLSVSVTIEDNNPTALGQDQTFLSVTIYDGTGNEQVRTSGPLDSGSLHTVFFENGLNKTGNNFVMTITGNDTGGDIVTNPVVEFFTVANNGLELGDSTCSLVEEVEEEEEELTGTALILDTDQDDNPVINTMSTLKDILGIGGTLLWLIIMLTIALGIWFHPISEDNPSISLGAIILSQVLMLIIGTVLGILSVGIIISVIVIAVVIIGIWVSKGLNRSSG